MGHSLAEWLTLREPFDVAARSERLAQAVSKALPPDRPVRMVSLWELDSLRGLAAALRQRRVPVARIDFGARPVGENRPQECFSALFMLKQQLAAALAKQESSRKVFWMQPAQSGPATDEKKA